MNALEQECAPIDSIEELLRFVENPPSWTGKTIEKNMRCGEVLANKYLRCHSTHVDILTDLPPRLVNSGVPKTILCHDMANGYLADRFVDGAPMGDGYTFSMWQHIDTFIYFSHHFITLPPLAWINAAHRNGVQVLGTLITEWQHGEALCAAFLHDAASISQLANALGKLTRICKLDGWLINIENPIRNVPRLLEFLKKLKATVEVYRPCSSMIWYDSVVSTGELDWQNQLNERNRCFFDVCDGIFLNYTWNLDDIRVSIANAERTDRTFDVYFGIDVFGRETLYDAGCGVQDALKMLRDEFASVALFAPGWTHETLSREPCETFFRRFVEHDRVFWRTAAPYLYAHPVCELFATRFYVGADERRYDLLKQQLQLTQVACPDDDDTAAAAAGAAAGGGGGGQRCGCMRMHCEENAEKGARFYYIFSDIAGATYYHLLATSILLRGVYVLHTCTQPGEGNAHDYMEVVCVYESADGMGRIHCVSLPERLHEVDGGVMCDKQTPGTHRYYTLKFMQFSRLLHIYAAFPRGANVVLTAMSLLRKDEDKQLTGALE